MATFGAGYSKSLRRAQFSVERILQRVHPPSSTGSSGGRARIIGGNNLAATPIFLQRATKSSSASVADPEFTASSSPPPPTPSRNSSSSSIGNAIRESVKSSILEKAADTSNTKVWSDNDLADVDGGINDSISLEQDSVNGFYLDRTTQYWPNLPPQLSPEDARADPFVLTKGELDTMSQSIREDLLDTEHPVLNKAASYFFGSADGGKKVRPMMVLLLSRALADTMQSASSSTPGTATTTAAATKMEGGEPTLLVTPQSWQRSDLPQAQRRLAEISEMIHTASLFHDDVIDGADTRRGMASVHMMFGSKMAILAGDYLLARSCIFLARLRNVHVVETMATIIEHLVRGEVMQMRATSCSTRNMNERMKYYLEKNFYKTGSLMANSCKSAALLGDCPPELVNASYNFGKHVGMAFQLVDDVLDFEGSLSSMGKPSLSDLKAGLSTAPILFAAESFPELEPLMDRKFKNEGDVDRAVELVFASDGIERTKELARVHAELAMEAVLEMGNGVHRNALINLAYKVVSRTK